MFYRDKRDCPFCRKKINAQAVVCPYCTKGVEPVRRVSLGKITIIVFGVLFVVGMLVQETSNVTAPQPNGWEVGKSCVYNRSDDRFVGAFLSSKPAPDGINHLVAVAVDPELDPSGGIRSGTTWELTVPKNATVKACKTK